MIRVYAALALVALLAVGGWWLHHTGYASGVEHCKAVHAEAEKQAKADQTARIARAASIQTQITHIGAVKVAESYEANHATVQTIIRTVHAHPAPASCVAGADSVQALREAVRRANAAASPLRVGSASKAAPDGP